MKTSLLLIVALCLVAFACAGKPKFKGNNGCTAERHGWHHESHEEVCQRGCSFHGKRCICFWNEDKGRGRCLESGKFRKKNAALQKAKAEAEYADSDEGKAAAKAKKEEIRKGYEEDNKADRRRKRELYETMDGIRNKWT